MRHRYVLEYVRDGVVVHHRRPGRASTNVTLKVARQYARVFAAALPVAGKSWGRRTGWLIRLVDRKTGLVVASYENVYGVTGRPRVQVL